MVFATVASIERILREEQAITAGTWKSLMLLLLLLLRLSLLMAAIQPKGECVLGSNNEAEARKGGEGRIGMKKQPVREKKNREVGGSSPKKRRCGVAKRRLAQTETDRDTVRKFWSRDFWNLCLHRNSGRFRPRYATSKILCTTQIGVLNRFVQVLIDDDPLENLSS